ncbi:MAG: hypothetical protein HQL08_12550 [Nitrospirae bacterium]|nr:hypothetical protein [Nitrospirota bacterium]
MIVFFVFSVFIIISCVILFGFIMPYLKAAKHKRLTALLALADSSLSSRRCITAKKNLTEIMQELFTSSGEPIFPDLVVRCLFDFGRYWNLCGQDNSSAANQAISNFEKCLDYFEKLKDDEKTPELSSLKHECEYRLGLLYLNQAEEMPSARKAKQLALAEKFLLLAIGNVEDLSKSAHSGAVVKPQVISARIRYALAKTYHMLSWNGKDSRELHLAKCVENASGAIHDCFSRDDFPSEWEQMVKLRTEACIDLCGYEGGHSYIDKCINFQNEYLGYLKSDGRLSEAFTGYLRLGDFHMKAVNPTVATGEIQTEGNKYDQIIRDFFGDESAESSTGEVVNLQHHIEAAHNAYVAALELGKAAILPKYVISGAYRKKAKTFIEMYKARPDENYLTDALQATQQWLDYCDSPNEKTEVMLIQGRLFILSGTAKADMKDKQALFTNARRAYQKAEEECSHNNDLDGKRYVEEMLRKVAFLMLQTAS